MLKRLVLVTLAALNLAAVTGCGRTTMTAAGFAAPRAAQGATLFAAGQKRNLGFDLDRAKQQAPHAKLRKLPPVQGLMPTRVDLRANCSPVYDQQDLGSCTAFAVAKGAREYLQRARGEKAVPLSALYVYYETRKLRNAVNLDSGATITDAMKALATAGAAPDALWGYDTNLFTQKPPAAAYKAAAEWKLTTGVQLAGPEEMKKAILRKQPVVFGMRIYKQFRDVGPDGMLPVPQNGDVMVGGHAVVAVGYDNKKRVFIVKNSFGTGWGDQGYFYLPYEYVTPENVMDIWTAS
jgi:C1A family cysteine protease